MNRSALHPFVATLLLALLGAGATLAFAEPAMSLPDDIASRLPADLVRLERMRAIAAGTSRPGPVVSAAGAALDVLPPQLTRLSLPATVAADKLSGAGSVKATYSATDDLSGVTNANGYVTGPTGQMQTIYFGTGIPPKGSPNVTDGRGLVHVSPWMVPGTWTVTFAMVFDDNGNYTAYNASQLASLGIASTFTVTNPKGGDGVGPTLVHGGVRTPTFSLSAKDPFSSRPAQFVVDVHAKDLGNGQVSGIGMAILSFCPTTPGGACLVAATSDALPGGIADGTTPAWQRPAEQGVAAGTYQLRQVDLYDQAGNRTSLVSSKFGGSTDFTPLFNTTTVTLTN